MKTILIKIVIIGMGALVPFLSFLPKTAFADGCVVSKIALLAGPWENSEDKTSYTVQAKDSAGVLCNASETLRLSFESSGAGTFMGQTGSPVQAFISKSTANRNFYYNNTSAAAHTLTIQAGYGAADNWSPIFEASHNTSVSLAPKEEEKKETSSPTDTPTNTSTTQPSGTQESTSVTQSSDSNGKRSSSTLARPRPFADDPLKLLVSHQKRVSVGQPVQFVAIPSGLEIPELNTMRYLWSFGDTSTSTARTPTHVYMRPGSYVVISMASRAGHEIAIRSEITVVSVALTAGRNTEGDVLLKNGTTQEIEISGLVVTDGARRFTVPDYTYLLPKASLALPLSSTKFSGDWQTASVYDRKGALLAKYSPVQAPEEIETSEEENSAEESETVDAEASVSDADAEAGADISDEVSDEETETSTASLEEETAVAEPPLGSSDEDQLAIAVTGPETGTASSGWLVSAAFVGVLLMGILALYVHKIV